MNELQIFRMTVLWPLVVGSAAFLLARTVLWLASPKLQREHAVACIIVGLAGVVVSWTIGLSWNDGVFYWIAFTVGMSILATILLFTVTLLALEMWRG